MIPYEERQFQDLLQLIFHKAGLDCRQYKDSYLKRRLAVRMRAMHIKAYSDYRKLLEREPEEYDKLLDRLTINVSKFFRDTDVYEQIRAKILPQWRKRMSLRVWSAGCANGQEPYSLAILLAQGLPASCNWSILATDIDPTVLERGRTGKYGSEIIQTVPVALRHRYFERTDNGEWLIQPALKRRVRFQTHDLTGEMPNSTFDMIMCRNVLIYFVSSLQKRLFQDFHEHLRMQGYLVLGMTETLLGDVRELYNIMDIRERIYQMKETPTTKPTTP